MLLLPLLLWTCASLESLAQGIQGTVRNIYEPEEGVRIELFVDGRLVDSTLSAEDGSYRFTGVPDGAVVLVYSLPGLATVTIQPGNYVYPQLYRVDALMLAALDPWSVQLHTGPDLPPRRPWVEPIRTDHLFYAPVSKEAGEIRVEAVDRFGGVYSASL